MKNFLFIFALLVVILVSCDNEEGINMGERLIGNWEYGFSKKGSEQTSPIGLPTYNFKDDGTFIKTLGSFDWRDEGTWIFKEDISTLTLTYKTYDNQVSDVKVSDLIIDKIDDKELVFKVEFNDTNTLGEFVEFEFIYYFKK